MFYFFLYATSFFAFMMALGQLVKGLRFLHLLLAGIFFSGGMNLLFLALLESQEIFHYPQAFFLNIPFAFFLGPLLFLYLKFLAQEQPRFKKIYFLHFLPGLLSLLFMLPVWMLEKYKKIEILMDLLFYRDFSFLMYLTILPTISFVIYFVLLSREHGGILKEKKQKTNIFFAFMLAIWAFAIAGNFYTLLFSSSKGISVIAGVLAVSILYLYLLHQRYPSYSEAFAHSIRKNLQEKSILKNIDTKLLKQNLEKLLNEEKIFTNEKLTLPLLASELNITPHQLSKFLNQEMKANFNRFLNHYRINEAKKIMRQNKDENILNIAYDVGFNSLSVFNAAFKEKEGITPSAFRKTRSNAITT